MNKQEMALYSAANKIITKPTTTTTTMRCTNAKYIDETYLSSETLITPSSPDMNIAALISSAVPSNLLNSSGLLTVLKRSFAFRGAGFISAAMMLISV